MSVPDDDLRRLPKVELHVHLEGTIVPATALVLARRHGTEPAALGLVDGRYPGRYRDFAHFLDGYGAVRSLVQTPDDLELVAGEFARGQAAQGVRYTEVSLAVTRLVDAGIPPRDLWAALRDGFAAGGGPESTIRILVEAHRDRGPDDAAAAVRLVEAADAPIAGFGLVGPRPAGVVEDDFGLLRTAADRLGLGLSVHAGETGPPAGIRAALDDLGADRIAHGISAIRDGDLVARLARDGTPLDQCLSSNLATGAVPALDAHPFPRLRAAGVNVTLGSDDPPFFGTTLRDELRIACDLVPLTRAGLADLQRRTARAAFLAPADAARIVAEIDAWERRTADQA